MTKEQTRLFELLKEFDDTCRSCGIKYFLTGETLKYATEEGSMGPNAAYASVIMTGDDCRAFIEATKRTAWPERELDYWCSNPEYPDYTVRYVASDTTAFDMTDYLNYKAHGMYIEIEVLRGLNNSKKAKAMRALEKPAVAEAIGNNSDGYWACSRKDRLTRAYYKASDKIIGKEKIKKKLFEFFSEKCCKPAADGTYYVCHNKSVLKGLPKELFEGDPKECEVNGYSFMIPSDCEMLIRRAKGKNADVFLVDSERPYTDTIEAMGLSETDIRNIHEADLRIADIEKSRRKYNKRAREDWRTVLQADARLRMHKYYMPKKDEILRLYEAEDYTKLNEEFKLFDEETEKLLPYKRSFSFDNELLDVYIHVLLYNGQSEKAENIIRWMPKSHLKEI